MEKILGQKSIKYKFTRNVILLLGVTYLVIVGILITYVRGYFYNSFYNSMKNNIVYSQKYYENNIGVNQSLIENIYDGDDSWWKSPNARVQIYNSDKKLLMDSQALLSVESSNNKDMDFDSEGHGTFNVFKLNSTGEHVMAVSVPLYSAGNMVGILRHISTLKSVDENIRNITFLFLFIAGLVTFLASIVSALMIDNIIRPVVSLTRTTRLMAEGDYDVRSDIGTNDEIGYLAKTFNYMAKEIKKKENLKNEFISSISHELRTPLTSIKGWAVTLKEPEFILQAADDIVNDKVSTLEQGLDTIDKEAERLRGMVEDLLDFSKFVSGKIELKLTTINPDSLINYIERFVGGRLERENKIFNLKKEGNVVEFTGDENRIKQVLINIIDNAIKFTNPSDTVSVTISQDSVNTYLTVEDTGAGIAKEDLGKVKERFYKGKHSKASNGIGLSIANEIAILHGGSLEIESELGKGTKMVTIIPREVRVDEVHNKTK